MSDWTEQAACQDLDPEVFFPDDGDLPGQVRAKRVCLGCSVRAQCVEYAIAEDIRYGVWGGFTERERRAAGRRRRKENLTERYRSAPVTVAEKFCPQCEATWPAEAFGNDTTTKDNLYWCCRKCAAERQAKRRAQQKAAQPA